MSRECLGGQWQSALMVPKTWTKSDLDKVTRTDISHDVGLSCCPPFVGAAQSADVLRSLSCTLSRRRSQLRVAVIIPPSLAATFSVHILQTHGSRRQQTTALVRSLFAASLATVDLPVIVRLDWRFCRSIAASATMSAVDDGHSRSLSKKFICTPSCVQSNGQVCWLHVGGCFSLAA